MKPVHIIIYLSLICLFLAISFGSQKASALTLLEAHKMAVANMERIAQSDEAIKQQLAEYNRRFSVVYPTLNLKATELIQDVPSGGTTGNAVQSTFVRRSRPEVAVQAIYTFFSGFKEFRAIAESKEQVKGARSDRERAIQLLYSDVAAAYFTQLARTREIALLQDRQRITQDRIKELRRFERVGRSRPSERVSVESTEKLVEAELESLQGDFEKSRALLTFLIGSEAPKDLPDEAPTIPSPPPPLEECLSDAGSRPDLQSLTHALKAAEYNVGYYKGDYWPTADLLGQYYPYRVGFVSDINWDVLLTLNWKFFEGGLTKADVEKARSEERQTKLAYQEAVRQAALDITTQHADLRAGLAQYKALQEAVDLSEENYKLQSKEYRLGLVTNLDVLATLNELYSTKRDAERTRLLLKFKEAQLDVARGRAPRQ